jgi:hypothetical protein
MISKWFKKHFIPHEGNGHRPHFLHGTNARKIVVLILALELVLFILPTIFFLHGPSFFASVLPSVLNELTNEKRTQANLGKLSTNPLLTRAAEMKALDMASKGYFAHNSPEGRTPWYWLGQAGYRYQIAGENLAVHFTDSRDVTEAWMNSPTHRANILKQGFTEVGTAVATGYYSGQPAIFVVQYYASASSPAVAPPVPTSSTQPAGLAVAQTSPPAPVSPPATVVLGEEVEIVSVVESPLPAPVSETVIEPVVASEATASSPSLIARSVASPRHTANTAMLAVLSLVALALLINSVMRVNVHHPDLITNGLFVAVIIFGVYLTNNHLLSTDPVLNYEIAFVSTELSQ